MQVTKSLGVKETDLAVADPVFVEKKLNERSSTPFPHELKKSLQSVEDVEKQDEDKAEPLAPKIQLGGKL